MSDLFGSHKAARIIFAVIAIKQDFVIDEHSQGLSGGVENLELCTCFNNCLGTKLKLMNGKSCLIPLLYISTNFGYFSI